MLLLAAQTKPPDELRHDDQEVGNERWSRRPRGGYYSPYNNPNLKDGKDGENLSMRLAKETVKFMKENKDEKFFAYLSFYAVHGPIQSTKEKWAKYRKKAEQNGIAESSFKMKKL